MKDRIKKINDYLDSCTPPDLIAGGILIVCFIGIAVHVVIFLKAIGNG